MSFAQVTAGIILAAGASSRMGRPKALLEYRGETFAERLVRVLSKYCDPVIVVLGYHADVIRERVRANFVVNPDPGRGQLSSLQTALVMLPDDIEGFLFTPVDCPTVDEQTVARLIHVFQEHQDSIVIPRVGDNIDIGRSLPRFGTRRGHPVCIPRSLIAEFLALAPTAETRVVVNRNADRIIYVDVEDPGILADIDDPEAYRALVEAKVQTKPQ